MLSALPSPPEGLFDAVRRVAADLLPNRIHSIGARPLNYDESKIVVIPRPLYHLNLDQLAEGSGLAAAHSVGWRSLVIMDDVPVALSDADVHEDGVAVQAMNYGPFVGGLTNAAAALEHAEEREVAGPAGHPEERILEITGAINFVGLWLHNDANSERDLLVPAAPAPPGLDANRIYRAQEILALIRRDRPGRGPDRAAGSGE